MRPSRRPHLLSHARLLARQRLRPRAALAVASPLVVVAVTAAAQDAARAPRAPCDPGARAGTHTVLLLHGLGRTARSMRPLARRLAACGYRVESIDYPSRSRAPDALVAHLHAEMQRCCAAPPGPVHVVTHSYGGLLLRHYLASHPLDSLGRVVMLAPPNAGSELADRMRRWPLYAVVTGPVGAAIGTDRGALPATLPPVTFELGVIAGGRSLNPLFSRWLPGPDDGKVTVARARVPGMRDFLVVPYGHTWLMQRRAVREAVVGFLGRGEFGSGSAARSEGTAGRGGPEESS